MEAAFHCRPRGGGDFSGFLFFSFSLSHERRARFRWITRVFFGIGDLSLERGVLRFRGVLVEQFRRKDKFRIAVSSF